MFYTGCPRSRSTEVKIAYQVSVKFVHESVLRKCEMYTEEFEQVSSPSFSLAAAVWLQIPRCLPETSERYW
jgi:hypothetical protein